MRSIILTILVLLAFRGPPAPAGTVTYHSSQGTAGGYTVNRNTGEHFFGNVPASLAIAYTYDPAIPAVVSGGTTTFTLATLTMGVTATGHYANSIASTAEQPGTIRFSGNAITFHTAQALVGVPTFAIDATFTGSPLTPGVLPDSLAGLEGILGTFHATAMGSIVYRGDSADVFGQVVMLPEPGSLVLLVMGAVGIVTICRRGNSRLCPKA